MKHVRITLSILPFSTFRSLEMKLSERKTFANSFTRKQVSVFPIDVASPHLKADSIKEISV
jgi:hypothetical protein